MIKEAIKFCIILCGEVFITFHKKNNRLRVHEMLQNNYIYCLVPHQSHWTVLRMFQF